MTDGTDGIASGYQLTEVTAGGPPVLETGGNLLIGVITLPHREAIPMIPVHPENTASDEEKKLSDSVDKLASEMSTNPLFKALIERGLSELEQGHYKKVTRE